MIIQRNDLIGVRKILYNLRKEYGQQLIYTQVVQGSVSFEDGNLNKTSTNITINSVIILPTKMYMAFSNLDRTIYQSVNDPNTKKIILPARYLNLLPNRDFDYITHEDQRWTVKNFIVIADSFLLTVTNVSVTR